MAPVESRSAVGGDWSSRPSRTKIPPFPTPPTTSHCCCSTMRLGLAGLTGGEAAGAGAGLFFGELLAEPPSVGLSTALEPPGASRASDFPVDRSILNSRPAGHVAPSGTSCQELVGRKAGPVECSRWMKADASLTRCFHGALWHLAAKASHPKLLPAGSAPPVLSASKAAASSPRPEPASNASWMASSLDSSVPPLRCSLLSTGRPNSLRTGGCFFSPMRTSRCETWPLLLRSRRSKSLRSGPSGATGAGQTSLCSHAGPCLGAWSSGVSLHFLQQCVAIIEEFECTR
mmetsp:Transcript_37408/g.105629  ORF Transcript_37408/g.105629 Transcript_37408/m.105629 type:complete len:288 (-) Transcript_37408:734-1597(-)